jgi:type VI secretion system protein ImpA
MSLWQRDEVIQPLAADRPCGENLEDTPLLASFDAFRLFGQPAPLNPAPEWPHIREQALQALGTSKDLRVLAHLAAAVLRTDGIRAFADSLYVAAQWLEQYWADTYPRIDEDAIQRRSALNCFADPMAVVDGLRRVPLVQSRQHGAITLRALDIAAGLLQPGEKDVRYDEAQITAAFAEMPLEELTGLQQGLAAAVAAVDSMAARMGSEGGPDAVPAFEPLAACLTKAERVARTHLAARTGAAGEAGTDAAGQLVANRPLGAIGSRHDAIAALDAVADFFRRHEPSSPVPLFVERAKRLVSKDFLEVLEDIAPDGLAQARSAGGLPRSE